MKSTRLTRRLAVALVVVAMATFGMGVGTSEAGKKPRTSNDTKVCKTSHGRVKTWNGYAYYQPTKASGPMQLVSYGFRYDGKNYNYPTGGKHFVNTYPQTKLDSASGTGCLIVKLPCPGQVDVVTADYRAPSRLVHQDAVNAFRRGKYFGGKMIRRKSCPTTHPKGRSAHALRVVLFRLGVRI